MADDQSQYHEWQEDKYAYWESLCGRCGACCGAFDDPCEHLDRNEKGYYCRIYKNRFGEHKTVGGKPMKCVPIRQILHQSWPGDECCGYKRRLKR